MDFGKEWSFHLGEASAASSPEYDDSDWVGVRLPHSFNAEDTFVPTRGYYRGPAWYRKKFRTSFRQRKVILRFDAVWGKVNIWLNGNDLGEYTDGLVGFELDITKHLVVGPNTLSIRVDNSHDPKILPGKQTPDYNIYGGLCGEVWLVKKNRIHFPWRSMVITTPRIERDRAEVHVISALNGNVERKQVRAIATISDPDGREVLRTGEVSPSVNNTLSFHGEVPSPLLWSPESPSLYTVELNLLVDGELVDCKVELFGIREFSFDENGGFFLNGERLQLRGVNRHQDFPGLGNVLPERLNRRDVEIIKEMGANFVRTSHYPQHPSFLAACDELGVLVYEEITTWQYIGGKDFIENADKMMTEMIRRDRNHPSIILWGMMNEGRSRKLLDKLRQTAFRHDPTRPTIYADNKLGEGVHIGTVFVPHVLGINYKLESMDAFHSAYPQVKLLVSEHTNADNTVRGKSDLEKVQSERIAADLDIIESRPYVAGSTLWSMHDYGTDYEPVWPIQRSGVLDVYRNPKEAFHMLSARWRKSPVIHISSDWNLPHKEGEEVEVKVYTNCEGVELTLNGESLGTKTGEIPLVWNLPYKKGELTAISGREGEPSLVDSITTPRCASQIQLTCPNEITADGRDGVVLVARITDDSGTLVHDYQGEVLFQIKGPAKFRGIGGLSTAAVNAGIANIVISSRERAGKIRVTASAEGLRPGVCTITSR